MKARQIKLCTLSGPFVAVFLFLALWPLAQFIPPPSPLETAEWYHRFYMDNLLGVRLAGIAMMLCASCVAMFSGAMISLTKLMEGKIAPWTNIMLLSSSMVAVLFCLAGIFFCITVFRADRAAEEVYLLSDMSWITTVIPSFPALFQTFAMGFATLSDTRAFPILPRWTAYVNFWIGIIFLPGSFVAMFLSGPFAWNGILAFWLPAVFFGVWYLLFTWVVWQRIDDDLLNSPRPN